MSYTAQFELTDGVLSKAVRQQLVALASNGVTWRSHVVLIGSAVVFIAVLYSKAHWVGLVSGLPLLFAALKGIVFVGSYLLLPRRACRRLGYLPNRHMQIEISPGFVSIQNASEKLELQPSAIAAITRTPDFWLISLQAGSTIPVPLSAVAADTQAELERLREALPRDQSQSAVQPFVAPDVLQRASPASARV